MKGFTLIELLVVIGILAILLAITLIAINPAKQFGNANDTKRSSDVNAILNAVGQYMADNKGAVPAGITAVAQNISNTGANLCTLLTPTYIANLPVDPSINNGTAVATNPCPATYDTGYTVMQGSNGRITVSTTTTYSGTAISVTR